MTRTVLLLSCLFLTGCASFRSTMRGWSNTNLVGDPAPALVGDAWVGEEPSVAGDWYLVAFLLPW